MGTNPDGISVNPNTNMIYVTNYGSNNVSIINGSSNTVTTTIPVGTNPDGIIFNSNTDVVYVTNSGSNDISVIDGSTNTVSATINVSTIPVAVNIDTNTKKIYVADYGSGSISVINGSTNYPSIPIQVSAKAGNGTISLNWQPPLEDGGLQISGYELVLYPQSSRQNTLIQSVSAASNSYTFSGLTPGTFYTYSITADNPNGGGQQYLSSSALEVLGPPSPPTGVQAIAGDQSASLSWTAPANTNGSPIITYLIEISGSSKLINTNSTSTSYIVTGLTNGQTYTFSVIAVNSMGDSDTSSPSNAVTPVGVPSMVATLSAYAVGSDSVVLSCTRPFNTGGYPLEGYIISYSNTQISVGPDQTTKTITNLTAGASYVFSIVAYNQVGYSIPASSKPVLVRGGYGFIPLDSPIRVYDTRRDSGYQGSGLTMMSGSLNSISFSSVVPFNATAVAINVTVTNTNARSYLTLFPSGDPRPLVSTLNWLPGQTLANFAQIKVGNNQSIYAYNFKGSADLIVDLTGYYTTTSPGSGLYNPVRPVKLFDSNNAYPLTSQAQKVCVMGQDGVPSTGVSAVLVNVTGINPTNYTYLTLYPDGSIPPETSNLNLAKGSSRMNMAIVRVGSDGCINVKNAFGSINLILDIYGYFTDASNPNSSGYFFNPLTPVRLVDTRVGSSFYGANTMLLPNQSFSFNPFTENSLMFNSMSNPMALAFNLTAVNASGSGTLGASNTAVVSVANIIYTSNEPVPNGVVSQLDSTGTLYIFNGASSDVYFIIDVTGWYG